MKYRKESDKNKLEPMVVVKVVLLLADKQNEKLNLRQLQKVLREINTIWYFTKGNTLFDESFVKNNINEWQLPSVGDYFCGCASVPIPYGHAYECEDIKDLGNALNEIRLTKKDVDCLITLIKSIIKQGKYKDPWSGNCYESQNLVSN